MKVLSIIVGVAIILGGVWYLLMTVPKVTPIDTEGLNVVSEQKPEVEVTKTDLNQGGTSKLPAGFPTKIPVEIANITESYRALYANRGVTQYTVSFTSLKSRETLWNIYSDFMKSDGYKIDATATSKSAGQVSGDKDNDTLSIVISVRGGLSLVQINLLDRQ